MKKVALVCIVLFLLACGRQETTTHDNENSNQNQVLESLSMETRVLSESMERPEKISFTTLSVDGIKEGFSRKEISKDFVLAFDPVGEILYQDCSEPSLEAFQNIRITHIKTGEHKDIDLERSYKYIDAIKVANGHLHFIGSNTETGVDYVEIYPDGKVKRMELAHFDRIAAFPSMEGFYVNLEKSIGQDKIENSLFYMEYGGDKGQELLKESFSVGEDGLVKEGHLFSNFYAMGNTVGFQELKDFSENAVEAKGSYLLDRENKILYKIPFIHRFSSYLAGNEELIVNLKAFKPEGDIEEDRCILYKNGEKGYRPFIVPGYEHSNFIRETRILEDGRLFIHGDASLDFIDLTNMRGKRISLKQENLNSFSFSQDGDLFFVEKGVDTDYLYWGSIENK